MGFNIGALPQFPWDTLGPARERAALHPQGAIDLTIGSPVDPVPALAQKALAAASDSHGYPAVVGTADLQESIARWLRRRGVTAEVAIVPTIGSKELVGLLPSLLALGPGDTVGFPDIAYPTYDVGARLAGCTPVLIDTESDPATWPRLNMLWLNSPANPTGHVLSMEQLRRIVAWARETGAIVVSDECYAPLTWDVAEAPSLLAAAGDDPTGLLIAYSTSKQSNMAGYRAAFLAGDPALVRPIIETRKHLGLMIPGPVQAAMAAVLDDDAHVIAQREIYRRRREALIAGAESAGLKNDPKSVAGLYLWLEYPGLDAWQIVDACAQAGLIVAPGTFYGEAGAKFVRVSLTASDRDVERAKVRFVELNRILRG